ncbi:MAG: nucleoside deaminase [Phycisphaerales bacterium JB037]
MPGTPSNPPDQLSELDRRALDAAYQQALKSRDEGGIPIGSSLIDPAGNIVAVGHNERVQSGDPTAHAEMVCIRHAGRRRDWHTLTMATTLSPCAMCSGTAILHKIPRLVIAERENFPGREDWLRNEGVEIVYAADQRCIELMRTFIAEHPDLWNEDIGIPE